jgi:hypothetical protein
MIKKKKILKFNIKSPDFFDDGPMYAKVVIDDALNRRIRELSTVVEEVKVYKIEEFNYNIQYYMDNNCRKQYPGRTECNILNVTSDSFWWTALIKHTDVLISTGPYLISNLP